MITEAQIEAALDAFYGRDRWELSPAQLTPLLELGAGAYGTVQKMAARGVAGGSGGGAPMTVVAAKMLRADAPPAAEAEFLAEMPLMMKLRHPQLVGLLGVVTKSDPLLLVLEYLPGGALDRWLLGHPACALDEQLYILYQVALGMVALHARGVLHRDLAARNVLVGVDLVCKVADYGLSREVAEDRDYYRHRTDRAVPLRWMAPEVRCGAGHGAGRGR